MNLSSFGVRFPGIFYHKIRALPLQTNGSRQSTSFRELKKFYKNATIATSDGWYEVNLDKRKLRTPSGKVFRVPHEGLALAVATEWNSQDEVVRRHSMHLTNLCNTALDNPLHITREDLTEAIVEYLETDTICYHHEHPPDLAELQEREWGPILQWARDRYQISIESTYGLSPPVISKESKDIIKRHLLVYSDWALIGYQFAVASMKSLLLVMAVVAHRITVERAVELATLEVVYQARQWGSVPWYHEVERCELQARLAAAVLFVHWCSESTTIRQKASLHLS